MSSTQKSPKPQLWAEMTPELFDTDTPPTQGSLFDATVGMAAPDPQGDLFSLEA